MFVLFCCLRQGFSAVALAGLKLRGLSASASTVLGVPPGYITRFYCLWDAKGVSLLELYF